VGDSEVRLVFEPDPWTITLTDGAEITIWADGYALKEDHYVFSVLLDQRPRVEMDICHIPVHVVRQIVTKE